MGVTVRSQGLGGKVRRERIQVGRTITIFIDNSPLQVLVCAHRYMTIERENRYGQGLCYVLTNDLHFDEVYEPCKGRPVQR